MQRLLFLAAKLAAILEEVCLFGRDDQAALHDAHADACLREKAGLCQPQAAQSNPRQSRPLLRVKLHGQEPFLFHRCVRRFARTPPWLIIRPSHHSLLFSGLVVSGPEVLPTPPARAFTASKKPFLPLPAYCSGISFSAKRLWITHCELPLEFRLPPKGINHCLEGARGCLVRPAMRRILRYARIGTPLFVACTDFIDVEKIVRHNRSHAPCFSAWPIRSATLLKGISVPLPLRHCRHADFANPGHLSSSSECVNNAKSLGPRLLCGMCNHSTHIKIA